MERMTRLPGRSIRHFGLGFQRHQLWLSGEYVLYREIFGYREDVKRFYYRDIQAIVCTPTGSWRTCSWLSGSLLVFLVICGALSAYEGVMLPFALAWIGATFSLVILLGNLVLGPSCSTTLYTAAAEAPLYSLGRKRSAEKAVASISEQVQQAQRDMAVEVPQGVVEQPVAAPLPFEA